MVDKSPEMWYNDSSLKNHNTTSEGGKYTMGDVDLYEYYTTPKEFCQEHHIDDLTARDTLQKFEERRSMRETYEWQIKPNLSENARRNWDLCSTQIWLKSDGSVSGLNRCKSRFCQMCNWREAKKNYKIVKQAMDEIEESEKHIFLFATFTIRNPSPTMLQPTIDRMMKAINRMQSRKFWRNRVKGYIRHFEITFNSEKQTFHPHLHYILAMPADYFANKDVYITIDQFKNMWCECAEIQNVSENQFKIEYINGREIENAVAETSKYAIKMAETVKVKNPRIIRILMQAVHGRRLIAFGGIYKGIKQKIDAEREKEVPIFEGMPTGTPYIFDHKTKRYKYSPYLFNKAKNAATKRVLIVDHETGEVLNHKEYYRRSDVKQAHERMRKTTERILHGTVTAAQLQKSKEYEVARRKEERYKLGMKNSSQQTTSDEDGNISNPP